ncbi:LamB/YcsF family protein [Peptoniphilus sp.]|jgi:UPF0271 protein|uniref:LamB/YcsF family protein n=1 Tax=Peptoniphilus sp. TaxID=1971214 RepID=UPI003D9239DA
MTYFVDLNSDIGESFGAYKIGMDEEIVKHVTSINCACGFHAGDPLIMDKTVAAAVENDVQIGAHPGYPDLMGFGRRKMAVKPEEARAYMLYQVGALDAFAKAHGRRLQHMKLHGAFYNTACNDEALANAVLDAVEEYDKDLILMVLSGSYIAKEGKKRGLRVAQEVFADRGYNEDGSLVNRSLPGAFVKDPKEAIPRVIKMIKENKVVTADGKEIDIVADSICVHGDNPQAIEFVKNIRKGLEEEGIVVKPLVDFLK